MAMDNTVTITGNASRSPELRFTPAGQPVASFGVAVNRRWQNRATQEWEEDVSFFDVTAWGELGENVSESVGKGTRVTVTGRLDQQTWEMNGENRSKVQIVADDVAVSLRWATAEVHRKERDGSGASAAGSNGGSRRQPVGVPGPTYNPNEEPF